MAVTFNGKRGAVGTLVQSVTGPNGEVSLQAGSKTFAPGGMGLKTLTVGASGANFATLDDALAYRATQGHTVIASGLTGNATVTGTDDVRVVTLTGTPLAAYVGYKGVVGIRIGGATKPIVRGWIISSSSVLLMAPLAESVVAAQVDIFSIVHYGIAIMPGETIELSDSTTRVIPGHTTLFCPVKGGATIYRSNPAAGHCFNSDSTQNEIKFQNLILGDSARVINSLPIILNTSLDVNFAIQDCEIHATSQDFLYATPGSLMGSLHLLNNKIHGAFDIVNPHVWRDLRVIGNKFVMWGQEILDGGSPTGIPVGDNTVSTSYPNINMDISNNEIDCYGVGLASGAVARGVEIRQALPNQAVVNIQANKFKIASVGGTTPKAYGVWVNALVTGTNTPTILSRGNIFNVAAASVANSMHSDEATYVIKRQGNYTIAGTVGSNTAAIAPEV